MSVLGVNLQLFVGSTPASSLSGIEALWWDVDDPVNIKTQPIGKNLAVTTDGSGYINLDLSLVSGLSSGQYGWLELYQPLGGDSKANPVFAGRVQTSTISSGQSMYYYDSGWMRPAGWLSLPTVLSTDQKFVGLHAIYEESNFLALSASGDYTFDPGDGSGAQNISSGVQFNYQYTYSSVAGNTDAGIANAVAVTFTASSSVVNWTAHGFLNGQKIAFSVINTTTGISVYTNYYIVNKATNTFQVATSAGGSPLTLTNNGTGAAYIPMYRQVIVTLTPQGGQNLTVLNLNLRHTQSGLQIYSSGLLDIAIASQYLTDLRLGVATPGAITQNITHAILEQVKLVNSDLRQCAHLFYKLYELASLPTFVTSSAAAASSAVTFTDAGDLVNLTSHGLRNGDSVIFTSITTTTGITTYQDYFVINATTNDFQVSQNYGGSAIALTNDGSGTCLKGTNFNFVLAYCYSLTSIPAFDVSAGIVFINGFQYCTSLQTVPKLNMSACVLLSLLFGFCYSLQTISLIDTSKNTSFLTMFQNCYSLRTIPLLNTSAGTSFYGMFYTCSSLIAVPLIDTSAGTTFSIMFGNCPALQSLPLLNLSAATTISSGSMCNGNASLSSASFSGTAVSITYASCKLSANALNDIFTRLATVSGKTITITGNWGAGSCDQSIATGKGWTVVN